MQVETAPFWINCSDLVAPLSRLTGKQVHNIVLEACDALSGGLGVNLGVWRLGGFAETDAATIAWRLVLKGWAPRPEDNDDHAWDTPYREFFLYRDEILAELPPGVRAPRCLGTVQNSDGMWLWLEDVGDVTAAKWTIGDYANAARHLGQFNGAYLGDRPLPCHDCVSSDWLRSWVDISGPAIGKMNAGVDQPLMRQVYPPAVARIYTELWDRRYPLLDALAMLPQTFCHRDAFRRNLVLLPRNDGGRDVVALDWEHAGVGALGEEIAQLMAASLVFLDLPADRIGVLRDMIIDHYMEGLNDAGQKVHPTIVSAGFAASIALRTGVGFVRFLLPYLTDETMRFATEEFLGRNAAQITEQLEAVVAWIADQGEYALAELLG